MSKLKKDDYNRAIEALKRFEVNYTNFFKLRNDILNSSSSTIGEFKNTNITSDVVLDKIIQLDELENNKEFMECRAVANALKIVSIDAKNIYKQLYVLKHTKYEIMDNTGLSQRTFERRKRELIYEVHNQLKKVN